MSTLLKQLSFDDPPEAPKVVKEKHDYLKGKYISGAPQPVTPVKKIEKKKIQNRKTSQSESSTNSTLVKLIFSDTFQLKNYLWQLPTLFLSALAYFISFTIFQKIQPSAIKDLLIPNSYMVLVLSLGFGHFFAIWYLFQNFRRSIMISLLLSILFFLRLHQMWNLTFIFLLILCFLATEFLLTYRTHRR